MWPSALLAQAVDAALESQPADPVASAPGQPVAGGAQTPAATPEGSRKSRRLQMIRALSFDRRPSAILKAWHEPPSKGPQMSADEPAKPDAATGVSPPAATAEKPAAPAAESAQAKPADAAASTAEGSPAVNPAATAKQAAEAKRIAAEDAAFQHELTKLQRQVTLAEWDNVRDYIANLEADEAQALHSQMLESLQSGAIGRMQVDPGMLQQLVASGADIFKIQQALSSLGQGPGAAYVEKNLLTMPDLLGLWLAAPGDINDDSIQKLGLILQVAIEAGLDLELFLAAPAIAEARQGPRTIAPELIAAPAAAAEQKAVDQDPSEPKRESPPEKLPRPAHRITARTVARLLCFARQESQAGGFLPTLEEATAAQDGSGLNLLARHILAKHNKEHKTIGLEAAWQATQAVLEIALPPAPPPAVAAQSQSAQVEASQVDKMQVDPSGIIAAVPTAPDSANDPARHRFQRARSARDEALARALELAPQLRQELGQQWLDDSFQQRIERGKEILTAIGSATSNALAAHPQNREFRQKGLELQKTAVEALLRASPDQAAAWRDVLTVVAAAWLKEAQVSRDLDDSASARGYRRDRYGNYFMFDDDPRMYAQQMGTGQATPIKIEDVLEQRPSDAWLALVAADYQPKFAEIFAQLHLKLQDEAAAFPQIQRLAATHPKRAKELAEEFVRVWTTTHNPNEQRDGYNPFNYYFGWERRADRIPLTRSKQQRNLVELAEWVQRLKTLPVGDLNETLLTNAFTTAHSKAEVYRLEAIESVFGSMSALKPRTIAELIQQMRGNLGGVWRMPDVQRQNSTNRKQRDIQAEVLRGYEVAQNVTSDALQAHPGHWALLLAQAAVLHDENDFHKELEKSSEFSQRRAAALDLFAQAAKAYVAALPEIPLDEQTVQAFEMWFYASLGAVDLPLITAAKTPDLRQPPLIRQALLSLPGEAAERHMSLFANNLFTRASDAKPELKQRFLKAGFEVVGDHKLAREARKLLDYYSDLVTEIKLQTQIDGPDVVGHSRPFGVFVNLVHTKEIERESGGFGKYLQNQNNSQMFFYNFGRPLENYRDKFRDFAVKSLEEHFEVLSITFQEASVNSRSLAEYGWRTTPYAYLLLQAKGPEVDKLAPLRMDLDFLDTSGYALLPIESPALPLDAKAELPPPRPATEIVVTQTLDERQADQGKLLLEVKATARGLAPDLKQLLDLQPAGFSIEKVDDRGLAVLEFDKDSAENAVRSERQWTVSLVATADGPQRAKLFHFAAAKLPVKEMHFQRYVDADLQEVAEEIALESQYGGASWLRPAVAVLAGLLVAGLGALLLRWRAGRRAAPPPKFVLPPNVTPFTAIGFLRELEAQAGFDEAARQELAESAAAIERHYFQTPQSDPPDVQGIAARWLAAALVRQ